MESYYFASNRWNLLLSSDETGAVSIFDWIITENHPTVQFLMTSEARWFRVLKGSIIVKTDARSFTLNAPLDEVLVPAGVRCTVQNAAGWQPSHVQCVVSGRGLERFITQNGQCGAGAVVEPEKLIEIAKRFGIECQVIRPADAPAISRWIAPACQSNEACL
jgi:hypothetical protein